MKTLARAALWLAVALLSGVALPFEAVGAVFGIAAETLNDWRREL